MIFYYGIRPTGDNLHLGHIMSLLNMFDEIKFNINEVSTIYFLMAESHAEISSISKNIIRNNTHLLTNKIISLFKTYIKFNDLNNYELLNKIKFIYQNDSIGFFHRDITYKYFSLANVNDFLTNPIYLNSNNHSVSFLLYPILQAFDVLLYCSPDEKIVVFVSGDQRANINIMKDINTKLKLNNLISFNIYENVIYDYKCKEKMSKSLNNFINFDDISSVKDYIFKYKTFGRETRTSLGDIDECPFNINIISFFTKYLNVKFDHIKLCNSGNIGCYECKKIVCNYIIEFTTEYIKMQLENHSINKVETELVDINYGKLNNIIDDVRSNNENN